MCVCVCVCLIFYMCVLKRERERDRQRENVLYFSMFTNVKWREMYSFAYECMWKREGERERESELERVGNKERGIVFILERERERE